MSIPSRTDFVSTTIYNPASVELDPQENESEYYSYNEHGKKISAKIKNNKRRITSCSTPMNTGNESDVGSLYDSSDEEFSQNQNYVNFENFNRKLCTWFINHSVSTQSFNELLEMLREINVPVARNKRELVTSVLNGKKLFNKRRKIIRNDPLEVNSSSTLDIHNEVKKLKKIVVNNNEQHKNEFRRLTEEIISLRNDVRRVKLSQLSGIFDDEEENLLPNFPLNSVEELNELEDNLQSNVVMVQQLKRVILRVGGEDVPTFIRTAVRKLITDELATNYTWAGTKSKPSIQNFILITLITEMCHQRFLNVENETIHRILQKNFLHARDRIEKRSKQIKADPI